MPGMSTFNIAKWEDNENLKHAATTWQIAKDSNFEDIVYEEDKSTEHLTFLKINLAIPAGQIYYIRAKRHFEDANGNEVENNTWIGPEPIIDNSSVVLEPLKPKIYIEDPYISEYNIDSQNGLTVKVLEPTKGVGCAGVDWIIRYKGKTVYTELNKQDDMFTLNVSNDVFNFTAADEIDVYVRFRGQLGVTSKLIKDNLELIKDLYKFDSSLINIPTDRTVEIPFEMTTNRDVKILSALILTMDKNLVEELKINENKIIVDGTKLEPNTSYLLNILVQYVDNDNKVQNTTQTHYIKTMRVTENKKFNHNLKLLNNFSEVLNTNYSNVDINTNFLITEEFITGHTPFINKSNKLNLDLLSLTNELEIDVIKQLNIDVSDVIRFELLANRTLLVVKLDKNNNPVASFYKFDVDTEGISLIKNINIPTTKQNITNNGIFELNNKLFVINKNPNSDNKVDLYSLDINNLGSFNLVKTFTLFNSEKINSLVYTPIDNDVILLLPVGENVGIRAYLIDLVKEDIFEGPAIQPDFRNKNLRAFWFENGDVVYFKEDDVDEFMIFNFKESKFETFTTNLTAGQPFNGFVKLKGLGLLPYLIKDDKVKFYYYR